MDYEKLFYEKSGLCGENRALQGKKLGYEKRAYEGAGD